MGEIVTDADRDEGVDREVPNDLGHQLSSEGVNRLIAEIDDDGALAPSLVLAPTRAGAEQTGGRGVDVDVDGVWDPNGGDNDIGMGGNVQCDGKGEENTSDLIYIICSFVKIGFPNANSSCVVDVDPIGKCW